MLELPGVVNGPDDKIRGRLGISACDDRFVGWRVVDIQTDALEVLGIGNASGYVGKWGSGRINGDVVVPTGE